MSKISDFMIVKAPSPQVADEVPASLEKMKTGVIGNRVKKEGVIQAPRDYLNFIGDGVTITDDGASTNIEVSQKSFTSYKEKYLDLGTKSANFVIDVSLAIVYKVTLSANCAITFTGWPADGYSRSIVLKIINSGSYTGTFTGVKWAGGTAPVITVSGMDRLVFVCDDGTEVQGFVAGSNIK